MNDRVRQKLSEIIQRYGRDICNEPKRCKGLLLDHCAGDRREVFVLVSALEENVVADLLAGLGGQSWGLVAGRLRRRLVEHRAMAEEAALWAVESWALALGVIAEQTLTPRSQSRVHPGPTDVITTRPALTQERSPSEPREQSPAPDLITTRVGQIPLKLIPAGEFWMGSPDTDPDAFDDEKPRHEVGISEAFYLGVTPVTQAQYEAVTGKNPSHFKGLPENPVEMLSWFEAASFCNKLSRQEGLAPYYAIRYSNQVRVAGGSGYRLPTEAEWEYACRAGMETSYCFGNHVASLAVNVLYSANSGTQTGPVGRKRPNAWGLYDMHGNVWEWCWDWYDRNYYRNSPRIDPLGPESHGNRVSRGGCWNDLAHELRAACRNARAPGVRFNYLGFRIARHQSSP